LLWLWQGLETAASIQPLAWELPYAAGRAGIKERKEKEGRKKGREEGRNPKSKVSHET